MYIYRVCVYIINDLCMPLKIIFVVKLIYIFFKLKTHKKNLRNALCKSNTAECSRTIRLNP